MFRKLTGYLLYVLGLEKELGHIQPWEFLKIKTIYFVAKSHPSPAWADRGQCQTGPRPQPQHLVKAVNKPLWCQKAHFSTTILVINCRTSMSHLEERVSYSYVWAVFWAPQSGRIKSWYFGGSKFWSTSPPAHQENLTSCRKRSHSGPNRSTASWE